MTDVQKTIQEGAMHMDATRYRYAEIDVQAVRESVHNPRRHFDEAKLKELAENIMQVGILTPLIVRPDPASTPKSPLYEIAAGHRRYRAAKLAKVALLPCLVREMSDQEFMEVLNIENLQREGLHPLDEAKGYELLMAAPYKMNVERIAEKVGRSVKYVYDRVKLLQLNKDARGLFWAGKIEAGHAILLARLTHEQQDQVIGTKEADYGNGGLFQPELDLYGAEDADDDGTQPVKAVSVRELEHYIKRHIRFNATKADSFLFPETVEKVIEATEGKKKIIEITREYLASDAVRGVDRQTRVYGEQAWKRADGKEGSKVCDRSVLGVIASGPGQGEAFQVCINKDRCLIHWGDVIKAREKRASATPEQRAKSDNKDEERETKAQREYAERERKREIWNKHEEKIIAAVEAKIKTMDAKPNGFLANCVVQYMDHGSKKVGFPRGKSHEDLIRYLGAIAIRDKARDWNAHETFPTVAKAMGLDLSKILPAEPVQTAAQKPAQAAKPKAKGKAKKKGK